LLEPEFVARARSRVCSTLAALICAANYCRTSAKKPESVDEKVNTGIDTAYLTGKFGNCTPEILKI
jgi:hypothetical protein